MKTEFINFLEKIEGKIKLSDVLHKETNNKSINMSGEVNIPKEWMKIHFKTYPRLDAIKLKFSPMDQKLKLSAILKARRSVRSFSGEDITLKELSHILYSACGLIDNNGSLDNSRRPYPSAGARYPLEVYSILLKSKSLKKGLYHYNVKQNSLELLLNKDLSRWLMKTCGKELWLKNVAAILVVTGVFDRTRIKYGDRGYRYILIEAGALLQNISLIANELGLGTCLIGGYIDNEVNKLLDIHSQKEYSLCLMAVGKYEK